MRFRIASLLSKPIASRKEKSDDLPHENLLKRMKLLQALRHSAQRITSQLEDSKLFTRPVEIGTFREAIVQEFLRPFLPSCYGLGAGQVFSADGATSDQIDIVVFDEVFSNVLFRDRKSMLFPCESVYGTIEVKSHLDATEITKAFANIASVKSLSRAPSTMLDILPFRYFKLGSGLKPPSQKRNPYLGVVFGFDGLAAQNLFKITNELLLSDAARRELSPDFIFCHRQGITLLKVKKDNIPSRFGGEFHHYGLINSGSDTVPLFFFVVNTCLNQIHLKAPDFDSYFVELINEIAKENGPVNKRPS
jgi:hypothetical protein